MEPASTIHVRPPVWALLLAVVLGGGFYVYGKSIEARDHTPAVISVTGEAKVAGTPDIAELSFGVQTGRQTTATEATEALSERMNAILAAVKGQGIEEKDIRTEQLSLNPAYDWREGQQIPRGFEASQTLRVKVRNLDKTSAVLGAATAAGANQAGGIAFTIDDPDELQAEARAEAIREAQAKAEVLAGQLGMRLGKIKGFSEGGSAPPTPYPVMMRAQANEADASFAPPLPSGEQDVQVSVTVTYELK